MGNRVGTSDPGVPRTLGTKSFRGTVVNRANRAEFNTASERLAVSDHLLLTEPAYDGGWQYPFNSSTNVFYSKNYLLAAVGSKALKSATPVSRCRPMIHHLSPANSDSCPTG